MLIPLICILIRRTHSEYGSAPCLSNVQRRINAAYDSEPKTGTLNLIIASFTQDRYGLLLSAQKLRTSEHDRRNVCPSEQCQRPGLIHEQV
ncbi:hypothetical protein J6590_002524 [Homalodisca vitripennis]|nr:hypothetical protein J6590_002524 [Homalodisca vitripennis]